MTDRKLLDQEELPSRRSFLGASVTVVAAVAATTIPVTNAIAATMVTKAFANHQDYAIGSHHCALCVHFRMPHSCEVVSGKINPNGVCRFFKAKTGKSASQLPMNPKSMSGGNSAGGTSSGGKGY